MKIVVVPAGTKTGAAAIRSLLNQASTNGLRREVVGIYRNIKKVPLDFGHNGMFTATQGDIEDASSLDLSDAEGVITITPPVFEDTDIVKRAEAVSMNVKTAIEKAGTIKNLVLLSSVLAHLDKGVGEIKTNNAAERILSTAKVENAVFVRCAYFMENWTSLNSGLKEPEPYFFSTITPFDSKLPMVAIKDIGQELARQVVAPGKRSRSPHIYELHGPRDYSPLDVQAAIRKALGRSVEIKAIGPDDLVPFYEKFFPPGIVGEWVEMARTFLPGGYALTHPPPEEEAEVVRGLVDLDEAMKEGLS